MDTTAKRKLLMRLMKAVDRRELEILDRRRRALEIADPDRREHTRRRLHLDKEIFDYHQQKLLREVHRHNLSCEFHKMIPCGCHIGRISGSAMIYNKAGTSDKKMFFYPGCFQKSLATNYDFYCNVRHRREDIFATSTNGTFSFFDTQDALRFTALVPTGATGERIISDVSTGRLCGASIEHRYLSAYSANGCRCVTESELLGVALTGNPAFKSTLGTITLESF